MTGGRVITLGCRHNLAESHAIRALLGDADVTVVNSCAVTEQAVRDTRRAIRRARRERPNTRLLVTGCAAEVEREALAVMPEVDGLVGEAHKLVASTYRPSPQRGEGQLAQRAGRGGMPGAPSPWRFAPVPLLQGESERHARAFLPIQTGCQHDCTFCITTIARGASRSTLPEHVIAAATAALDAGHQEIVLTAVDLTSYGLDLPQPLTLAALVERLLAELPALPRLRLSSLDSIEIDDHLFALITQEPRVMPHVHLSLQSGDDLILKRMKRRHSRLDAVRLVERLKVARPALAIGADLIAGFPTETEAMAERSLALLDDCDIVHAHIFPYSPRPGTAAARMPQVEREVARARAARLRERAAERHAAWLRRFVGTTQRVLVELDGKSGYTEAYARTSLSLQGREKCGEQRSEGEGTPAAPSPWSLRDRSLSPAGRGRIVEALTTAATPTHLIATPA